MLRTAALLLGLAALTLTSTASTATLATGLRGTVTLSPIRPVCLEDEPCSKAAAGVTLRFSRNGLVVGRVKTDTSGKYRIALARGAYLVSFAPRPAPRSIAPKVVRVVAGRMTRMDFEIDTGLR